MMGKEKKEKKAFLHLFWENLNIATRGKINRKWGLSDDWTDYIQNHEKVKWWRKKSGGGKFNKNRRKKKIFSSWLNH